MASTQSPTSAVSLLPQGTKGSGAEWRTRRTARSVRGSVPNNSARRLVLSCRITLISVAPSITWLLVTTMPEASTMKPEPKDWPRRPGWGAPSPRSPPCGGWPGRLRLKKSRKNSSKGLPGGAWGASGASGRAPGRDAGAPPIVEEILTTAGRSTRARGAKLSGRPPVMAGGVTVGLTGGAAAAGGSATGGRVWAKGAWDSIGPARPSAMAARGRRQLVKRMITS